MKYKYFNNTLEIHVYLEFVTYTDTGTFDDNGIKIYKKKKAKTDKTNKKTAAQYISMFKKGIKEAYDADIIGTKGDFKKKVNFKTKLVIHDKANKKYNSDQKFIEVRIGGECPNCKFDIPNWYHAESNNWNAPGHIDYKDTAIIYMPTDEQVKSNENETYTVENEEKPIPEGYWTPKEDYGSSAAHELGHVLGLQDAYFDESDRCADNDETGYKYRKIHYDNLMKHHVYYKKINANGVEMMLEAIDENTGMPMFLSQYFKSYNGHKISKVIKNKKDNEKDTDDEEDKKDKEKKK